MAGNCFDNSVRFYIEKDPKYFFTCSLTRWRLLASRDKLVSLYLMI